MDEWRRVVISGKGKELLTAPSFLGISWGKEWPLQGVGKHGPTSEPLAPCRESPLPRPDAEYSPDQDQGILCFLSLKLPLPPCSTLPTSGASLISLPPATASTLSLSHWNEK